MGVLIDASVLIAWERGDVDIERQVADRPEEEFFLSVITASELLHGVHRAGDPRIRARRSAFVEAVLAEFPVLPIEILTARVHSELWAELARRGEAMGAHDLWLAAAAIGRGLTLVSADWRAFQRVPGLELEVWSD